MEPLRNGQRAWWPWGCVLLAVIPCCGPVGLMQWRLSPGRDFCRTIAVGEPLEAVMRRADRSGLFHPTDAAEEPDPGKRYLRRTIGPMCEYRCIVSHDGARVTEQQGMLGGLCS